MKILLSIHVAGEDGVEERSIRLFEEEEKGSG